MIERHLLEERRDQAFEDLQALDEQCAQGEIDDATAARLRASYEHEALIAVQRLEATAVAPEDHQASSAPAPRRRLGRRVSGAVLLVGAMALAVLAVPGALRDRGPGGVVSGEDVSGSAEGRDLATVTNEEMEAVVAENPDIVPMRLRLAHRYLDDGYTSKALGHYLEVLDREPRNTEAMTHLGWVTFNGGDADLAAQLLEASLEESTDQPEAQWFLANVRLYGQDRPDDAVRILESLVAEGAVAPDDRAALDDVLTQARAAAEGGEE